LHWDGQWRGFAFDRDGKFWKDAAGAELDEGLRSRVGEAAALLENFTGVAVAAYTEKDPAAYGFDQPALIIELTEKTAAGKKVVLGRETEGGRFAKGPASSFVLVAGQGEVEKLLALVRPPRSEKPQTSAPSGGS